MIQRQELTNQYVRKERERKRARMVEEPSSPITESGLAEVTVVSNLDTLSARHLMLWISLQLVTH